MNQTLIDRITNAVLYEGYLLYPYRPSSVKNRQRWTFGGIYPQAHSLAQGVGDPWIMQTECLVAGTPATVLQIRVRFLHLLERTVSRLPQPLTDWPAASEPVMEPLAQAPSASAGEASPRAGAWGLWEAVVQAPSASAGEAAPRAGELLLQSWQEAVERDIQLPPFLLGDLTEHPRQNPFHFPSSRTLEPVRGPGPAIAGVVVRQQLVVEGTVELSAQLAGEGLFKITVRILNQTPLANACEQSRDQVLLHTLASTHTILEVRDGAFVSLLDPPPAWQTLAAECRNIGAWPVLVGDEGARDAMLSSPIILYDYPQVAPESPGDLFDATEIDEILTLRILTMTEDEKREMTAGDERGRALLERTEALAREQLMHLHGAVRGLRPISAPDLSNPWSAHTDRRPLECVQIGAFEVRKGDRVRLSPRGGADIMDIALKGKTATVESVEQDFENQVYLAVSVDDDPGKDLGTTGQPGHRFFFRPEEVEPLGVDEGCP
jgi:hypothetical protein